MALDKNTLNQLRIDRNAPEPSRARPFFPIGIAAALLLIALAAWALLGRDRPVEVRTAAARETGGGGNTHSTTLLNASGYVTPRREATVSSKVTGKVVEVLVEEGMRVEAGQVLARLDPSNLDAQLALAQAQMEASQSVLAETEVRIHEAELHLRRTHNLARENIATEADLERADAELNSLRARLLRQQVEVTVARQQRAVWEQQREDTIIRAPFAGVVTSKNAQPGEMISPMSAGGSFTRTGICTLVDMGSLEIEVDVNESFIQRVREDQPVQATLDAYPDWKIPGRVIAIIPTADRQKATVRVRVGFDELDERILPQMGVKVAFQNPENNVAGVPAGITIPRAGLVQEGGQAFVFLARDGRAERRAITAGETRGEETTVASGIAAGERVILNPPPGLTHGDSIREGKR